MKQLKIFYTALFMVVFTITTVNSQNNFFNQRYIDPYNPEYVKGEVLVKFKDDAIVKPSVKRNNATTGISSIDKILKPYNIKKVEKIFKETREQRQRKTVRTIRDFKGKEIEVPALFNIYKLKFDTIWDAKQIIEELQKDKNVEFAEPNYLVYTSGETKVSLSPKQSYIKKRKTKNRNTTPNDPLFNQQSGITATQIDQVWDTITGDSTQIIAILDTGVDWMHPDLTDNIWNNTDETVGDGIDNDNNGYYDDIRGWDFINNDNNPMDDNSHGTHVAGIAAARGNNGIGIAGVNWYAKIMPVKVFRSDGTADAATISQGINYAANNGATVINMSFGSYGYSVTMKTALQNACLTADLVASAGNDHLSIYSPDPLIPTVQYPAAYDFVLGIEAQAGFSNYDPDGPIISTLSEHYNYELTAPGNCIISTAPNGNYKIMSGTSMSAPFVSGAISLYRAQFPTASREKLWGDFIYTSSGYIQIYDAFYSNASPKFDLLEYDIEDTLAGNDKDGQADAGELIQIYTTIRNTWGLADSAYAILSQSIYGDTNDVHIVMDSVFFGSISTFGTLTNSSNPFLVRIDSNCFNNRNITLNLTMKNKGDTASFTQEINFKIYNGEELSGLLCSDTTLTPDKLWVVTNNLRICDSVTLTILPGTHLEIYAGIDNRGTINAIGTADSMIYVKGAGLNKDATLKYVKLDLCGGSINVLDNWSSYAFYNKTLDHCIITNFHRIDAGKITNCELNTNNHFYGSPPPGLGNTDTIISSRILNCTYMDIGLNSHLSQCLIDNFYTDSYSFSSTFSYCVFDKIYNTTVIHHPNDPSYWHPCFFINNSYEQSKKNSFLKNGKMVFFVEATGNNNFLNYPNQYWGTTDSIKIREKYYDFMQNASLPYLDVNPILTAPSDSCPVHVWKVLVNGKDAQDEVVPPVSIGAQKFEVYFNKVMDTTVTPQLSFGVRFPFIQNVVEDSASWSTDRKIWTAYFTTQLFTGDGINTIRVANAVDTAGLTIPVEDSRFKFVIQATGVQSVNFMATPGIGKVDLEWNNTGLVDFLGFNMYRYMDLTDSTHSTPQIINTSLITDTVYTDFNVIPDSTYNYYYKIVNTDFKETDSSKIVVATPFSAANGDANGDMAVNVLDITNIVSYMLNQNPAPFLFDAADVNYDGQINVLDIIGVVQLISGDKSVPLTDIIELSEIPAYYDIADNILSFESEGNVAALQVKFKVQGLKDKVKSTRILNDMKIFSMAKGFEFSYGVVGDEIIGILYSLIGKEIPAGTQELFRFNGVDISEIEVNKIFGGDLSGDYVPVFKKGQQVNLQTPDDYGLKVQPNPFTQSTVISWQLAEDAMVNISIYNLKGEKIKQIKNTYQSAGIYQQTWNATDNNGKKLTAGIYICHIKAKTENKTIRKNVKIILMR